MNPLIAHIEIPSTDLERSKKYYSDVFGWDFRDFGNGYKLFNNHNGIMVGLRKVDSVASGNTTVFHVAVRDIEKVMTKCSDAGGKIFKSKTVIPAMGWYALINDIDGNVVGLYQKN
ncbi:MAG: VOC family protein [Ignavibacteriales bacterium]|nr:MAG: VOC family protein [Ignavibacteriales bacterium]